MTNTAANLLFALLSTPMTIYNVSAMRPLRRQQGEGWFDLYFRLYFNAGSSLFVSAVFWLGTVGAGPFANGGGWKPLIALAWNLVLVGATADRARIVVEHSRARGHLPQSRE
jgi:hypothetical protein